MSENRDERQLAALVLAAGKGTRMGAERAKVLHRIRGSMMLELVLDTVGQTGAEPIVVVVGFDKDAVIRALPGNVAWVHQKEQLGTGHAVLQAEAVFGDFPGDILVLYGDVPLVKKTTLLAVVEEHRRTQAEATLATATVNEESTYGRVIRGADGTFERIVEYKDANTEERKIREINTGLYCFQSAPLFQALKEISNDNEQREYYLTDVFAILKKRGSRIGAYRLKDAAEALGVDTLKGLEEAEKLLDGRNGKA
ncbi:MAG TPA: hypothetical protein ENN09_04705 [Planctomycetes bacterium]|nr:hypothetical protein [Planctomycetota bacterium]